MMVMRQCFGATRNREQPPLAPACPGVGPNRWQLPSVNYMVSIVELHSQLLRLELELVSGRVGCAHICMLRPDHGYFSTPAPLPLPC